MEIFQSFIGFIMNFIKYIQDMVAYFRAKNDGEEVEEPTFSA